MKKDKMLTMRISDKEKKGLESLAKQEGHNSVAAFIMWLVRQYKSNRLKR
ncbi:hypothetical protein ACFL0T_08515 [Candidatus Omnitrophota bacterium]